MMGIRARILIPLIAVAALYGVVGTVVLHRAGMRQCERHLRDRADALAQSIAVAVRLNDDADVVQSYVATLAEREHDVEIVVVASGEPLRVIACTDPEWIGREVEDLPDGKHTFADLRLALETNRPYIDAHMHFGDGDARDSMDFTLPFRLAARDETQTTIPAGVMLHLDGRAIYAGQAAETAVLIAGLVTAVGAFAVATYGLLRIAVLAPLGKILRIVRLRTAGDRQARVGLSQADELGMLAAAFDGMLDDLTQQERRNEVAASDAKRARREAERIAKELVNYKEALDQHALVTITNVRGVITYVNDKFCEVSQYSREELIGKTFRVVNSGRHCREFWGGMWKHILSGEVWSADVCNRAKDGTEFWSHTTIVPFRGGDGEIERFIAIRPDITARKRLENAVRESEERFELAVRGANVGIWDWTWADNKVYCSGRLKQILGYGDDEFPIRPIALRRLLHSADRRRAFSALRAHVRQGCDCDFDARILANTGDWRWCNVRGAAIRDADGRIRRMAGSLCDITSLKSAQLQLLDAALRDKLTNLPNRRMLNSHLRRLVQRAEATGRFDFAVLFLDFDRFKLVNDCLGHEVGDALLRAIAERLTSRIRVSDDVADEDTGNLVARLGGDEFVVLLDGLTDREEGLAEARSLLDALAEPYRLGEHDVYSAASIGIVFAGPQSGAADDLLRDADTAMYEAKRTGRGRYVVFDEAMRHRVQRRAQLEHDLRKALERNELRLEYQLIVCLRSGKVCGVEALIRWRHAALGNVPPSEFIPLAEESDLILRLGHWVLREACAQQARWRSSLGAFAPPRMNVNVSRKQFAQPQFAGEVHSVLTHAGLSPDELQLEITEEAFSGDLQRLGDTMRELKQLGVRLAVDDFGIGQSAFASVQRFPIATIKIDRSLTTEIESNRDSAALVHAVVVLARNLGIKVVVEGIENERQVLAVAELGCDMGQGFFFAAPLPPDAVGALLGGGLRDIHTTGASAFIQRWRDRIFVYDAGGA